MRPAPVAARNQPRAATARAQARHEWLTTAPSLMHELKFTELWRFFFKQPASFWFVCLYMFFEYVRPQAIYPALQAVPLPLMTIALAFATFLMEGQKIRKLYWMDYLLLGFTGVVFASSIAAYDPGYALQNIVEVYLSWIIIYFLLTNSVDTEKKFVIFMLLYFLWCLKMSQFGTRMIVMRGFSFSSWGLTCAPQFFHNSGECGIQLTMYFAASLYFLLGVMAYVKKRTKWILMIMPATAAIAIMGSSSRGAQLALAAVLLWIVLRSQRRVRAIIIAAFASVVLYAIMPEEQKDRFRTMGTDETSMSRRLYWEHGIEIMNNHPVLGIGFQNWMVYYPRVYRGFYQLPHNIFVEAGAELGYIGLGMFILLILGTFKCNWETRKLASKVPRGHLLHSMAHGFDGALLGYLVGGFFVTVLYYPFFWINFAMTVILHNVTRRRALEAGVLTKRRAIKPPRRNLHTQHAT